MLGREGGSGIAGRPHSLSGSISCSKRRPRPAVGAGLLRCGEGSRGQGAPVAPSPRIASLPLSELSGELTARVSFFPSGFLTVFDTGKFWPPGPPSCPGMGAGWVGACPSLWLTSGVPRALGGYLWGFPLAAAAPVGAGLPSRSRQGWAGRQAGPSPPVPRPPLLQLTHPRPLPSLVRGRLCAGRPPGAPRLRRPSVRQHSGSGCPGVPAARGQPQEGPVRHAYVGAGQPAGEVCWGGPASAPGDSPSDGEVCAPPRTPQPLGGNPASSLRESPIWLCIRSLLSRASMA